MSCYDVRIWGLHAFLHKEYASLCQNKYVKKINERRYFLQNNKNNSDIISVCQFCTLASFEIIAQVAFN